jgi:hypothetical protein
VWELRHVWHEIPRMHRNKEKRGFRREIWKAEKVLIVNMPSASFLSRISSVWDKVRDGSIGIGLGRLPSFKGRPDVWHAGGLSFGIWDIRS